MTKFKFIILMLVAALSVTSCDSDEYGGSVQTPANLISFAVINDAPIVIAPGEEVTYSFNVTYAKGLASMKVSLDGEVIEGSEKIWDDAPTEAQYTFSYLVKGSQFGQTLDFVFTATGVDGYSQSVDYPLWITANDGEFIVSVPNDVASKIYSNESVAFEVSVSSTNVLKSFVVTKDGVQIDSKTDFAATEKQYKHQFAYAPAAEDIDKDVEFHFVATDVKGNIAETYYTVSVVKADVIGKMLYSEIFDTSMKISSTEAYNTTAGGITGNPATSFSNTAITTYNTLLVVDENNPEGELVPNPGAMEGCSVYDDEIDKIKYTFLYDDVQKRSEVTLSKFDSSKWIEVTGTYLWYRKNEGGWFRVDGIRLHGAVSLKLSYSQATVNGKIKVEYSVDEGVTWEQICETSTVAKAHEQKFALPQSAETISLKFTENGGTDHARIDNIKLVEIL